MKFKELRELLNRMHAVAAGGVFVTADDRPLTVEELDDLDVLVRVQDDDNLLVGDLTSAVVDAGCTETYAFVIDGGQQ